MDTVNTFLKISFNLLSLKDKKHFDDGKKYVEAEDRRTLKDNNIRRGVSTSQISLQAYTHNKLSRRQSYVVNTNISF